MVRNGAMVLAHMLSRVQLSAIPWTVAHSLLCPWNSPGKNTGVGCHFLPNPGIKPTSLASPALAGGFFTTTPPGKPEMVLSL